MARAGGDVCAHPAVRIASRKMSWAALLVRPDRKGHWTATSKFWLRSKPGVITCHRRPIVPSGGAGHNAGRTQLRLSDGFPLVHEHAIPGIDEPGNRECDNASPSNGGIAERGRELYERVRVGLPSPSSRTWSLTLDVHGAPVHPAADIRLPELRFEPGAPQLARHRELEQDVAALVCARALVGGQWRALQDASELAADEVPRDRADDGDTELAAEESASDQKLGVAGPWYAPWGMAGGSYVVVTVAHR